MKRAVLSVVLIASACAHRPVLYGYGTTLARAQAQCWQQEQLPTTDTTRAADGGIQMRWLPSGLTRQGATVRDIRTIPAETIVRQCQLVRTLTVREDGDNDTRIQRAVAKARNQVAKAGGNVLRVDSTSGNAYAHSFFVSAYRCTGLPAT